MSVVTMDSIVNKVLAVGNKEHNQHWPPYIIDEQWETATNFIIDRCVEIFPTKNSIVDVIKPFLRTKQISVVDGMILFPDQYRNILGIAINVTLDKKGLCSQADRPNDPTAKTQEQLDRERKRGKCISHSVSLVDQDEWDSRTTSKYKFPTYAKPIACIFAGEGIRVCPYDIGSVELRYVREPKKNIYGYQLLSDDTYVFDPAVSVESEWEQTATQYLFKAMNSLYSIYLRDPDMRDWNNELKTVGLL